MKLVPLLQSRDYSETEDKDRGDSPGVRDVFDMTVATVATAAESFDDSRPNAQEYLINFLYIFILLSSFKSNASCDYPKASMD